VVATGGGVILRDENRELLKRSGFVVWLTADPHTIWERLQRDATSAERRPDLSIGGLPEVEELLRQREPLYQACADLMTDTADRSVAEVVEDLLGQLRAGAR
jgi:shikimate kinase